jgi:ABC-type transport system substrate-binding protein
MNHLSVRAARCLLFVVVVFLSVTAAVHPGAAPVREDQPKTGGLIRVRDFVASYKPSLDPASGSWVFPIEQIFEGLVRIDSRLDLAPALAEYWMGSEDGKRTTFILKRGVRFHHGRDLDSQDVKYSFERLLRRETQSPYAGLIAGKVVGAREFREGRAPEVSGFRAPEKFVFEIEWKSPSVSSLYLLSMSFCKILPRDKLAEEGAGFFYKPSGTGAFRFSSWMRSPQLDIVGVRMERFASYHGPKAYLDAVEYSPHLTVDHFMNGEADIMPFLSDRMASSGCQAVVGGAYTESYLAFSCHIPPFDRMVVRKAVTAALNKDRLAGINQGPDRVRRPTSSYIPSGLPGFLPSEETAYFDPEQARRLLDELGYSDERRFPSLTLFVLAPRADATIRLAREIAAQLDAVGVPVSVRTIMAADELRDVRTPYLALFTWMMDYPDAENVILPLFGSASEGLHLLSRYASPALDKLLEESSAEKSWTRRLGLFREMERILTADLPAVPLFTEERLAVQSVVRGVRPPPLGSSYLDAKTLWLDRRGPRP